MSNNMGSDAQTEATQPLMARYEDQLQSLKSRLERATHILESLVDNLNGAEPPELQPKSSDKPDVPRDELPMIGRMSRAADDAFSAIGQLEHQLERLQSLQLL